ncbi:hypothetical protein MG293_006993 [Ovis ammon polii]|uniref:Sulfotransferase n=3 Tax=Bovidae TaxID=9895 RepID=A0AAD4UA89_OVIAM|nr:hypothetical protein MG293_006993 [Ovis ammon polii]
MKVLILACLVALALAREQEELNVVSETVESLSSSEESITHINKKIEKFQSEEQQQTEDELQDKIHPFAQAQSLVYPFTGPIPNSLPQNILPLTQTPVVVPPFLQPEIMGVPKVKETMVPKHKEMPFPKYPVEPFTESQSLTLTDVEKLHLPLPLVQSWMHQPPQPLPPTVMFPPQSVLSLSQPKVLPVPQKAVPQRDMPIQAFLLYQEPVLGPVRGPFPILTRGPAKQLYSLQVVPLYSYEKRIKTSNFQLTKDHNCGVPHNSLDSSEGTKIGKTPGKSNSHKTVVDFTLTPHAYYSYQPDLKLVYHSMMSSSKPAYKDYFGRIGGMPLYKKFIKCWHNVEKFEAKPDDVVIVTYPKSGVKQLKEIASPRIVKTHLPAELLPVSFWEKNCKIIYLSRNAKDLVVSYYFFFLMVTANPDPGSFQDFVEKFMNGEGIVGDWKNYFTVALNEKFDKHYEEQMKGSTLKFRTEI